MGEPIRILDLATTMITLTGLKPFEDMEIVFTGLRPGEKLFEELSTTGEDMAKTRHPKIFIGKLESYAPERVRFALWRLAKLAREADPEAIRRFLNDFLSEAQLSVGVSVLNDDALPQLGLPKSHAVSPRPVTETPVPETR
jgi:FlaA1/EpsC-like NDP-sugar epimerase